MVRKKDVIVGFMAIFFLTATLFTIRATSTATRSTGTPYDPWADVSGITPGVPDGVIDMQDIGYEASIYLAQGTPIDRSNIMSVTYDSGWLNITGMCGQYFNVTHGLGTTDVMVDITGKTTLDGGVHQRYLGLTGKTPGWSKTYGGTNFDMADAMVKTSDEGYALAGTTMSFGAGGYDAWLVKTDSAGTMQWNKTYGGTINDEADALVQTGDGGYALAGYTDSFGAGAWDMWLVKTDASGNMQWNKTYGGTGNDKAYALVQTGDGGYALAGTTASFGTGNDAWLVKTDASGNMLWNKTYGGTSWDYADALVKTSDGGYALAGETNSFGLGNGDAWLVKTDASGNMQWNKTYGGTDEDWANALVQTADGGYALAGETDSFGASNGNAYLVKTDAAGNMQWNKTYGGTNEDGANDLVQTADGGYALAGITNSFGAGAWLVKTDASGNMQWNKTYGGTGNDVADALVQTSDGGYALAGYTTSFGAGLGDAWLVKTDVESGLAWADSSANTVTLYRGATDIYWNFVRVQIWTHM